MSETTKPTLALVPAEGVADPEVGRFITALKETRGRTREALKGLPDGTIDVAPQGASSIGTILYHVAGIEADWLYDDILDTQQTDWPHELFPVDLREDGVHLTPFVGETLEEHLGRLKNVRARLIATISPMSSVELHALRERKDYKLSAAWALHHLMQHEAEHRSQIGSVREALGAARGW